MSALLERPADLREVPLAVAWPPRPGEITVTMSSSQWDTFLAVAYEERCILLELDDLERPVRAFQRAGLDGSVEGR